MCVRTLDRPLGSFNPLPPPKRGETVREELVHVDLIEFQSTPPAEARGDPGTSSSAPSNILFQSTPPAEARGDPKSKGSSRPASSFNPLPPPKRGETRALQSGRTAQSGFNPLPPPKRGETRRRRRLRRDRGVSIHSPRRSEGRRLRPRSTDELVHIVVSIHSPRRSEGRRHVFPCPALALMFQSTPPAEARGDVVTCSRPPRSLSFNPLPPPKRGETRRCYREGSHRQVSIHSPRRSEGRRPVSGGRPYIVGVSIHSPRRSEGRRATAAKDSQAKEFQSTPPAEARGDRWPKLSLRHSKSFNPLPPPKRGETAQPLGREHPTLFQSTPPAEARGDLASPEEHQGQPVWFQSTPPAEARGDAGVARASTLRRLGSFNPLPPPKRGETNQSRDESQRHRVSIHSPRRSEGRRGLMRD